MGVYWALKVCPLLWKGDEKLPGIINRAKGEIPADAIFVRRGHLQHIGASWDGGNTLRHHTLSITKETNLKDAVAFTYGALLGRGSELSGTG